MIYYCFSTTLCLVHCWRGCLTCITLHVYIYGTWTDRKFLFLLVITRWWPLTHLFWTKICYIIWIQYFKSFRRYHHFPKRSIRRCILCTWYTRILVSPNRISFSNVKLVFATFQKPMLFKYSKLMFQWIFQLQLHSNPLVSMCYRQYRYCGQ